VPAYPGPGQAGRFVNRIWEDVPAMRAQIAALGRELLKNKVQMVTLESTSDYWRVWFYALAPATVQYMPESLRRWPMTALQPDSTAPEPTNRPRERNQW